MYTFSMGGYSILHNGDYSGNVTIERQNDKGDYEEFEVPFDVLKSFMAEYVRKTLHSRLDDMSADQILHVSKARI